MLVQQEQLSTGPGAWAGFRRDISLVPGSFMGREAPGPAQLLSSISPGPGSDHLAGQAAAKMQPSRISPVARGFL